MKARWFITGISFSKGQDERFSKQEQTFAVKLNVGIIYCFLPKNRQVICRIKC
jgi:hypothetical protein